MLLTTDDEGLDTPFVSRVALNARAPLRHVTIEASFVHEAYS